MNSAPFASMSLALLSLCLFAAIVEGIPAPDTDKKQIQSTPAIHKKQAPPTPATPASDSRTECSDILGCEIYTSCIKKSLRCGESGFTLSYAKKRCEAIRRITPREISRAGKLWGIKTETCFRRRVKFLLDRYETIGIFGPPTCLQWEMDAIAELNICYNEEEIVSDLRPLSMSDVLNLIKVMKVDEPDPYYSAIVDTGLLAVVNRTHPTAVAEVLGSQTTPTRIILCVHGGMKDNGIHIAPGTLVPSDYVDAVNITLDLGENDTLYYAGMSQDDLCFNRGHAFGVGAQISEFHLVVWFTYSMTLPTVARTLYSIPGLTTGVMFELTMVNGSHPRTKDLDNCGDGSRQVTEFCDFAGGYPACAFNCTVNPGYDCGIEKLEASTCWMEVCGDGRKTRGEGCDDGNTIGGDGCAECAVEDDYVCSTVYNMTSHCIQQAKAKPVDSVVKPADSKLTVDFRPAPLASAESGDLLRVTSAAAGNGYRLSSSLTILVMLLSTSLLR